MSLLLDAAGTSRVLHRLGVAAVLPPELLLDGDGPEPVRPDVLAALALLGAPGAVRLHVRSGTPGLHRVAALAVAGRGGSALVRDVDGGVPDRCTCTAFAAAVLPEVLHALVPPLPSLPAAGRTAVRAGDAALLGAPGAGLLDEAQEQVAEALGGPFAASTAVTVLGPGTVGVVLLVHAAGGWWQLVPDADPGGAPALTVVPVDGVALGAVVAPLVAAALAGAAA